MTRQKTKSANKLMSGRENLSSLSAQSDNGGEPFQISERDYVSSLARGLEILRAFSKTRKKMTLSEVAAETGITRAATRRFLLTLVREGYAATDGKLFDLTPQVLELGFSVLSRIATWDIAKPFLERLSEQIEESVSASVLDGFDVVYVSGAQFNRIISVGVSVGNRLPAYCTATGRVLLAGQPEGDWDAIVKAIKLEPRTQHTVTSKARFREILKETRAQGYSLVDQELEIGLLSIAIPLVTLSGRTVGSINVGCPSVRATPKDMVRRILPALQETGQQITQALPT
ncbi:MAG: IclR family transcriptional regulator domain-containing protein [Inquilinaceae bacterium]